MDNPSPGPGWWLASDGSWYPQQWEYDWQFTRGSNGMNEMQQMAREMGLRGWEMVSLAIKLTGVGTQMNPHETFYYCYFKRPIKPGP
jgi:hypothetical protein